MTLLISSGLGLGGQGRRYVCQSHQGPFSALFHNQTVISRFWGGLRLASRIPSTTFLGISCHWISLQRAHAWNFSSLPIIKSVIQVRCPSAVWGFRLRSNGPKRVVSQRDGWWGTHLHVLVFPFRTSELRSDSRKPWETSSAPLVSTHSPSSLSGRADRSCAGLTTCHQLHSCQPAPPLLSLTHSVPESPVWLRPHLCALQSCPPQFFKNIPQILSFFCFPLSGAFPAHSEYNQKTSPWPQIAVGSRVFSLWPRLPHSIPLCPSSSHPGLPSVLPPYHTRFHLSCFAECVTSPHPPDRHVAFSLIHSHLIHMLPSSLAPLSEVTPLSHGTPYS